MNSNQFLDMLTEMTKKFETAFTFQSRCDPKLVLKIALSCANNDVNELLVEVLEMFTLYLMRGTKISKMGAKMNNSGKERLKILIQKYKLKDHASAEEIASGKALSLNKLISAFPYQLLILMKNKEFPRPLGQNVLREANASGFPEFLKTPIFLSVIPLPRKPRTRGIWAIGKEGIKKCLTIINGVIAYSFLESFVLSEWGKQKVVIEPSIIFSNVISVAQNILKSEFITQDMKETNFISMFQDEIDIYFEKIENLINYTNSKYPGFKSNVACHFYYDVKLMKFDCKAKTLCRHIMR